MKTRVFALFVGTAIGIAAVLGPGVVQAEKPSTQVQRHMHFFTDANGEIVWVGPDVCDLPMNDQGWSAFHLMVHAGTAGANLELGRVFCTEFEGKN
jgi:hypothetical protein